MGAEVKNVERDKEEKTERGRETERGRGAADFKK